MAAPVASSSSKVPKDHEIPAEGPEAEPSLVYSWFLPTTVSKSLGKPAGIQKGSEMCLQAFALPGDSWDLGTSA